MAENNITEELNKLATEIVAENSKLNTVLSQLNVAKEKPTRMERVTDGYRMIQVSNLAYSFIRFLPFADKSKLSEEALRLSENLKAGFESLGSLASKDDLPQELREFLNTK